MHRLLGLLVAPLLRFLGGLRYPVLFAVVAVAFLVDVIVPEPLPFIDEILLGSITLLLASRKAHKSERALDSDDEATASS